MIQKLSINRTIPFFFVDCVSLFVLVSELDRVIAKFKFYKTSVDDNWYLCCETCSKPFDRIHLKFNYFKRDKLSRLKSENWKIIRWLKCQFRMQWVSLSFIESSCELSLSRSSSSWFRVSILFIYSMELIFNRMINKFLYFSSAKKDSSAFFCTKKLIWLNSIGEFTCEMWSNCCQLSHTHTRARLLSVVVVYLIKFLFVLLSILSCHRAFYVAEGE